MATPDPADIDFERLSWHDCHIWGLEFRVGAKEEHFTSELVLRLDFILEWVCGIDGTYRFRVAPAELVFHGLTDLCVSVAWPDTDLQVAMSLPSIGLIERERVADQKVFLDHPYYRWRIRLNWPDGGEITFGAVDFTQVLLAEPLLTEQQMLTPSERAGLLLGESGPGSVTRR
jgi:hypothetical protein